MDPLPNYLRALVHCERHLRDGHASIEVSGGGGDDLFAVHIAYLLRLCGDAFAKALELRDAAIDTLLAEEKGHGGSSSGGVMSGLPGGEGQTTA